MDVINYSFLRAHLKDVMDRVVGNREEAVITRSSGESVVMVGLEDWNSIQETLYLLSTPKNASRLRESIAELESNGGQERDLVEP